MYISDGGRLQRMLETETEYNESTGCIILKRPTCKGPVNITLTHWPMRISMPVYRAAYMFHKGYFPKELLVRHKCDDKFCVNPNHLELGTSKDNAKDKVNRERHPKAKLNITQVEEIRLSHWPRHVLANFYGVSVSTITNIRTHKSWAA